MKKKILLLGIILVAILTITGCGKEEKIAINEDGAKFKEEYESLNGKVNSGGKEHRTLTIAEDNPFIYITPEKLLEKMDNKESFYVYFGSKFCPWCRAVIETATMVAKKKKIDKIYYIDIWDDETNEVLRDKYIINDNNELEQVIQGTKSYYEILKRFDSLLDNYTLTDKKGNQVQVEEKRIFAPTFIFIEKGNAKRLVSGIPDMLKNPREELSEEVLKTEENTFNDFFDEDCRC